MACRQVQAGKPWFEGCLTGVGDCAHATRPDLGQGGAMAIEVSLTALKLLQLLIAFMSLTITAWFTFGKR